jgi:hypothetical protein
LNEVAALASAAAPDLQKQFETLKKEASAGAARQQKEADLGKTIVAGSAEAGGHTMVAGSYEAGAAAAPAAARKAGAAAAAVRPAVARPAPPPPKKSPLPMVIAAVVVIALVIGGVVGYKRLSAPVAESTYIEVNAVPWGMVKSITKPDGTVVKQVDQQTPVRVALPPGEYKVVVAGPRGDQKTESVKITAEQGGSVYPVFEAIDVDKILNQN